MRFYCPQAVHPLEGWKDLPSLASLSKKEADDWAEEFAKTRNIPTRTLRKPHGWVPPGPLPENPSTSKQEPPTAEADAWRPDREGQALKRHEKKLRRTGYARPSRYDRLASAFEVFGATMSEELDECWQDVKAIPKVQPNAQADLTDDWLEVRNIPKVFYMVVKGYGPEYMAIKQVRCVGLVRRSPRMGGPSYRGIETQVLWQGAKYKVRPEDQGKQYAYSIKNCDLTLGDAKVRFHKYLEEHLVQSRANVQHWEESVAALQRDIDSVKKQNADWEAFDIGETLKCQGF